MREALSKCISALLALVFRVGDNAGAQTDNEGPHKSGHNRGVADTANLAKKRITAKAGSGSESPAGSPSSSVNLKSALAARSQSLFDRLSIDEKAVVREYFHLCHEVGKLIFSVRLYGNILSNDLLERFERVELHYHGLGLLPVLPSGVSYSANNPQGAIALGLIQERLHGRGITILHARGIRRTIQRLDRGHRNSGSGPRKGSR